MRTWSDHQLEEAVSNSTSIRQVLKKLNLIEAGGNYHAVKKRIDYLMLNTDHFTGKGWRIGLEVATVKPRELSKLLVKESNYQSHKLKIRLFKEKIKSRACEECGWAKISFDGRIPLELDHINGDHTDNRLENLRILCPNCHSLKPTHRGKNKVRKGSVA